LAVNTENWGIHGASELSVTTSMTALADGVAFGWVESTVQASDWNSLSIADTSKITDVKYDLLHL
jgi:hypothetical protein